MTVHGSTPYARNRRRRPRWLALSFVALVALEIVTLVSLWRTAGPWPTILTLLVASLVGGWLIRREGPRAWRALGEAMQTGRMPGRELADAALVLIGGILILLPGLVTDLLGLLVILPATRPFFRRLLSSVVGARLVAGPVVRGSTVPSTEPSPRPPGEPPALEGRIVD